MRRALFAALQLALVTTLAVVVAAQETGGRIVGTATDPSGALLPGVSVSLAGTHIMGTQTSSTDDRGRYRLNGVPPGMYELTFSLSGFAPAKRTEVRVLAGGASEQNVTLKVAGVSESVEVKSSAAVVDTQTAKVGTTYDRDWIDNAPIQRQSLFDLVASAPGSDPAAVRVFQPSSYGSMFDQNLYQLDGVDLSNNFGGGIPTLVQPSTDILEQVEVLSLGAPAEYGNVQGAVFNAVTRQGTNQFHGTAAYYYQGKSLTGRNTSKEQDGGFPFSRVQYRDFSAQLGGPIAKDKLWFFGAYQYLRDSSAAGIAPQYADLRGVNHFFGKLNFQPHAKHTIVALTNFDKTDIRFGLLPNNAPETAEGRRQRIVTPSVIYTGILSDRTVLETRYAGFYIKDRDGIADGGARQIATRFEEPATGRVSGAVFGWFDYKLSRTSFASKLSHHASDFLGAGHDFKFGVQYNDAPVEGLYGINDRVYLYADGSAYGYQYVPFAYGGTSKGVGAFFEDAVQVGKRLTLELGTRYDHTHTRAFEEPQLDGNAKPTGKVFPAVDYYTWNTVSPRLGFNLKLTSDGRTILKGHYGRYYRGGQTGEFISSVPSVSPAFFGAWNAATRSFQDTVLAFDNSNLEFGTNFQTPRTDQLALSLEREVHGIIGLSATYLHKRSRKLPGWVDTGGIYRQVPYVDNVGADATGNTILIYQLQNARDERFFVFTTPDGTKSDVDAFSLTATKRMANKWQMTSSATLTHSTGDRINGVTGRLNFSEFGRNPNDYVNSNGLLGRDRFLLLKTQILYVGLPGGLTVGANYFYASGYPMLRTVRIPATNLGNPVKAEPRTGSKRFPNLNELDLRLQKDFRAKSDVRLSLFVDLFNAFNDDAYQDVQSTLGTAANYHRPSAFVAPRRAMLGAKVSF